MLTVAWRLPLDVYCCLLACLQWNGELGINAGVQFLFFRKKWSIPIVRSPVPSCY